MASNDQFESQFSITAEETIQFFNIFNESEPFHGVLQSESSINGGERSSSDARQEILGKHLLKCKHDLAEKLHTPCPMDRSDEDALA